MRLAAGCMTGTSLDAIDAALVAIEGTGLSMSARLVEGRSAPLGDLAAPLRRLAEQHPTTAAQIADLSHRLALAHADLLRALLGERRPALVALHGQTVFHRPPLSWQLMTPAPVAHAVRAPVVFDLRAADLAAGGQGAPITPLADWVFLGGGPSPVAVVNLGGFCNVTLLPASRPPPARDPAGEIESIRGLDVCPCNHILDAVARATLGAAFDEDGRHASTGSVHDEALTDLEGVLASRARPNRSLGTGDEALDWVSRWRAHVPGPDLAATACAAIGSAIAEAIADRRALLAGGGARNRALAAAIASASTATVEPLQPADLAQFREAASMAVLGALCQDRVPITLQAVTGVRAPAPVAGAWVLP
ncbi:MAG: anhydro-N-acetylmuramic acid kinase [Phycisphaerae bacterium]|nr:anhydro-N-acetylmuramic acid kinase [Phycisphaerae bacterium]